MSTPRLAPHRVDRLLGAVLTVASDLELEAVLSHIVHAACDLVEARYGALGVIDGDGTALAAFVHHGMPAEVVEDIGELPEGHGLLGLLIEHPEPIRVDDLSAHPSSYGFPPGHPPMRSFLGAPIRVGGEAYGNLYLTEKRGGGGFSQEDQDLLVALAAVAGSAIANARLYAEVRRRERWLEAVGAVATALLDGATGAEVSHRVVAGASGLLGAGGACLLEPDEAGVRVLASEGTAPTGHLEVEDPAVAGALGDGRVRRTEQGGVFAGPAVWAPVRSGGEVVALLGVGRTRSFTAGEEELLASFAEQVSVAWSFERVQAQLQHLSLIADRERIGRDLHDTVIQRLFATGLSLQASQRKVQDRPEVSERLEQAVDDIDGIVREIRATIFALQSAGEDDRGVRAQVLDVVEELTGVLPRAPRVRFDGPIDTVVGPEVRDHLLPVVREALTNVAKHAAASDIELELTAEGAGVRLRIVDDGVGISPDAVHGEGFGLTNLRERAEALGGTFSISSPGPDGGTVVLWAVPGS
ncbi:MAG: GAF domain-containing protein [Nitriliruptoraceae bacterium]